MIAEVYFRKMPNGVPFSNCYCTEVEKIENYQLAIADNDNVWICHHRLEEFYTRKELIQLGKYYDVPANELIFVKNEYEHRKLRHKGIQGRNHTNKRSKRGQKFCSKYGYSGKLCAKDMGPELWQLYLKKENYL